MKLCITQKVWDTYQAKLRSIAPDVEAVLLSREGEFSESLEGVEAFFLSEDLYRVPAATVQAAVGVATSGLRWVHSSSAGIDHPMFQAVLDSGAVLTHSPGLHSKPIAEYVLGHMLQGAKNIGAHAADQASHAWRPRESRELTGLTVGIVGYGGIGAAIAHLARAFEMRVIATKRSPIVDPNLDELLTPDRLDELLSASDYVVLALPLTDESRGLIGAAELASMKRDAVLINVARGEVVETGALIEALEAGTIAGAVLDVTDPEPLPPESPLWDAPNVVITPHDSGDSRFAFERTCEHWLRNVARYARGESLLDAVESTGLGNNSPERRPLGVED